MFARVLLSCLLLCLCTSRSASAAIVIFTGAMESGDGMTLGSVPPAIDFEISLDFAESSNGFASINGGMFLSSVADIPIVGGEIVLIEGGSNDQGIFSIDTASPTGTFSANFLGDAFFDNEVTQANLISLINSASPTTISANFGSGGNYTGRVNSAAVPEPSAVGAIAVASLLAVRRRRRVALG